MKNVLLIMTLLTAYLGFSQNLVSGYILTKTGQPVVGANVYLDGTYDGSSSNEKGWFDNGVF